MMLYILETDARDVNTDSTRTKKVREKSRECHNYKPQPSQTPRGRGNRQIQTSTNRTNVRKVLPPGSPTGIHSSLGPSGNRTSYLRSSGQPMTISSNLNCKYMYFGFNLGRRGLSLSPLTDQSTFSEKNPDQCLEEE